MLMDILIVLAVALEAYLLGSIDTGILYPNSSTMTMSANTAAARPA